MKQLRKCPDCDAPMAWGRTLNDINDLPMIVPLWKCTNPACGIVELDVEAVNNAQEKIRKKIAQLDEAEMLAKRKPGEPEPRGLFHELKLVVNNRRKGDD